MLLCNFFGSYKDIQHKKLSTRKIIIELPQNFDLKAYFVFVCSLIPYFDLQLPYFLFNFNFVFFYYVFDFVFIFFNFRFGIAFGIRFGLNLDSD